MPCCGCSSGGATEPEAGLLDLCLLEAADQKVKLSFRMPARVSAASAPSSWWLLSEREPEPEFTVSLLGGPHSDLFGPRKERVSGRRGHQTMYEVGGLQPDTEYTVYVSVEQRGETITETLEVRTAPATTAQFAGEDWGRSLPQSSGAVFFKPGDLGEKKGPYDMDKKAAQSQPYGSISSHTSSTSSVSSSAPLRPLFDAVHPGPSITPQRPPPPRSLAGEGDDVSTIAPSDIGTIDPGEPGGDFDERSPAFERTDENWDPHYEGAHRESSFQSTTQRGYSIGSASTPRGASSEAVDGLVTHEVQLDEFLARYVDLEVTCDRENSHVKTALAGAGGGAGPGPVGVTLALLASSATWWRNPPEAMSDTSDTSELAPEAVDPIEPDRFGLRWQGASHGSPGGATSWLLTLPAAGRIILLTAEGVIEGGVASPGRGVTGGRAITLDPDTVRAHPPRLFERLNGTEGKVHLCRTLPCTRIHLSSDTGNYRSPLSMQWRSHDARRAIRHLSSISELFGPNVALALPSRLSSMPLSRRIFHQSPSRRRKEYPRKRLRDRPPTPRMSWFLDHTFDTTAAQAWYSKVAAKLKWTSQVPLGDHDSQIIRHLSDPKVAFSILAVLCVVTYSSLFPGPVPGGVLGSALYYTARIAVVVASWLWHIGATFMGPVVSSLVFGSVGAWCAMSAGIVAASSVGAAAFVNVCSRAAAAATHAFGTAAGSAGVNAGAAPSSGPAPTSGAAEGQAPGGARLGIAKTPEAAPTVGSCPCSAPGVKWSTEAGPQQLAQWCAAKSSESLPLLRVDAEHFVLPFGVSSSRQSHGWHDLHETCDKFIAHTRHVARMGVTGTGLGQGFNFASGSVRWSCRAPGPRRDRRRACGRVERAACCGLGARRVPVPPRMGAPTGSTFGDTPVPRSEATAPPPPLRPEAPVWSPFAGPAQRSGYGSCSPAPKLPLASHDLTAQSMFHGSVVPQDDGPRHPRLAGMMGLHGSGTVPLGPQDHSWSPVPLAGSMPAERHVWDPYRDPNGLASLGGGMIGQSPPTAHHGMSSNPMMPGTPVMTGGLASFGIHPGGVAPHGPNLWPQGQMGSSHLPSWGPSHGPNPHDSMHGLASAIGSLQLVLSKGNEDVVRQLERSNRKDEARGGDRHTIAGITREDELLKFALGGCDTQPVALCPGETGKEWIRSMRTAVLERRSDLVKVDCPVKIDFYVALAVSLCSWGIPEDGESPKVYLDAKDFPALGADELQRWRAPPVSDSVLRASGRDPLTIETWAECCGRLAYFFGLVYGRHHEPSIVECIAALRRKHNSDSRTWSFLVVQRIFSNLLCRYLTEWRQIVRNVIRLSGLEDPNKSHVRRICQTLGPDGAPVVRPRGVRPLGGDAAYPQGPKVAPQITRLAGPSSSANPIALSLQTAEAARTDTMPSAGVPSAEGQLFLGVRCRQLVYCQLVYRQLKDT
ncbi:unnamed protein product [Polarella glacialis]|uniref:Uncharacterized protein n=1 Tax=Polarella glacialis TaxID=89957 RepID=A0A813JV43_POLGL|nr:unnamed protein product [Polarella glacialis]